MQEKIGIDKLALLARIKVEQKEKEKFKKEFEAILGYVSKLRDINEEELRIENYESEIKNVMREDKDYHQPGEFSEDLLKEAPIIEKNYIKVKHILD